MAENDLYDEFDKITNQLVSLSSQMVKLREQFSRTLEENEELKMENQNLRKHLDKEDNAGKDFEDHNLPSSRLNLEKLYEKGFHVCQQFYGSHRKNNEECVFCLGVIYGRGHAKENKA
ncbi:DNA replication initiation control protein YabA [Companilactobacillus mishanensis]|uniref:DNA replication initiation control protein YabA n=1 Tax=Companilactobacillus mishanensis TaxID=2486008 RepID=A0ABW9P6C1_9LACO|nr:DNA replication initiation control protein YabA [Companilactobacillus mishanensis]MQS44823.1 DNA replication initiation control protein YabA [Companilactobacillus mishanensis]